MKILPLLFVALLLSGCRRELWETVTLPRPAALTEAEIVFALEQLDSQTPPQVTVAGETVQVRYNALRIAPRNFAFHLENLADRKDTP